MRSAQRRMVILALLLATPGLASCGSSSSSGVPSTSTAVSTPAGTGAAAQSTTVPSLLPLSPDWTASLDGAAVFARPIAALGRIFVATEKDDVYALDPSSGRVLWRANIGTPLTNVTSAAGCGDIDPLGITSTPVLDPRTQTLYVVGEISSGGRSPSVHRELVGFDALTGQVVRTADADPTGGGDSQVNLQQRADLALANGRVYAGFGGLYGDCGRYHGWVVGISEQAGPPNVEFDVTPGNQGGAVWEPGGPAIDSTGNIFVSTGNRNNPQDPNVAYAESVVKLSPTLTLEASFADSAATGDDDLSTDSPTLLDNGTVFAIGKTDIGYILTQSTLTVVAKIAHLCGSDPDGANAYDPSTNTLYIPCRGGGIQEVDLASHTRGWKKGAVNSTPILVDGSLWALQYSDGELQALNPSTGATLQTLRVGPVPNFATPTITGKLLVLGTMTAVKAYIGS